MYDRSVIVIMSNCSIIDIHIRCSISIVHNSQLSVDCASCNTHNIRCSVVMADQGGDESSEKAVTAQDEDSSVINLETKKENSGAEMCCKRGQVNCCTKQY